MPRYHISGTVFYADGFDFDDIDAPNEDAARLEVERRVFEGDLYQPDPQWQETCIECVTTVVDTPVDKPA